MLAEIIVAKKCRYKKFLIVFN